MESGKKHLLLINEKGSFKVLITMNPDGQPHAAVKNSMLFDPDKEKIIYLEYIESSKTNRNMLHALWRDKTVQCLICTNDERSILVEGKPSEAFISGPVFQEYYAMASASGHDLSTVWLIQPLKVTDESLNVREQEEMRLHPMLVHLDRLVKETT